MELWVGKTTMPPIGSNYAKSRKYHGAELGKIPLRLLASSDCRIHELCLVIQISYSEISKLIRVHTRD